MKMAKPITVAPPSHKDEGCDWGRPGFDDDLREEVRSLVKEGIPVTMRGGKLKYRNKAEGVEFDSDIFALEIINQGRHLWVVEAFRIQIWVERVLKAVSVHDVKALKQDMRGTLSWQWLERSFDAYRPRDAFLCLQSSDGESRRDDLFKLDGPLTSAFLLDAMQKAERALTAQIKLRLFLETKELAPVRELNGLGIQAVQIHVDSDSEITVRLNVHKSSSSPVHLVKVRALVEEFKASGKAALKEEQSPDVMDSSSLDLV